ncbi:MAG: hypothetical protein WCP18_00250 [bacterium]
MTMRTRFKISVYFLLFVMASTGLGFLMWYNSVQIRDYKRLSDMTDIQSRLNIYFLHYSSYQVDGCSSGLIVSDCKGSADRPSFLGGITDQLGGNYAYVFSALSQNDYKVSFVLETKVGGFAPGRYFLTPSGISDK